jgi:hypothetical protein
MTTHGEFAQPPRIAAWLITLFTPAEETESILGDLLEEYSYLVSTSGLAFGWRWYWRQTLQTIAHFRAGFGVAPWSTLALVVAGLLLIRFGFEWYRQAYAALLDQYGIYEYISALGSRHPSVDVSLYVSWMARGVVIGHIFVAMLAGAIVAFAAKGREMMTTMAFCLSATVLGVAGCLLMLARTGDYAFLLLWALPTVLADSIAIAVGGTLVRMRRRVLNTRPAGHAR